MAPVLEVELEQGWEDPVVSRKEALWAGLLETGKVVQPGSPGPVDFFVLMIAASFAFWFALRSPSLSLPARL